MCRDEQSRERPVRRLLTDVAVMLAEQTLWRATGAELAMGTIDQLMVGVASAHGLTGAAVRRELWAEVGDGIRR
jgi:hypothetical protein